MWILGFFPLRDSILRRGSVIKSNEIIQGIKMKMIIFFISLLIAEMVKAAHGGGGLRGKGHGKASTIV